MRIKREGNVMKILTVIPARGGSKGIPKKNIRFIAGQPLLAYAIKCAKQSVYDMEVVVSSDEKEIQNIAGKFGAHIIERPAQLAGDKVTLDPVICHATNTMEAENQCHYDIVITMQPTSPLLTAATLDNAIRFFVDNDYDTVLSGVNDPRLSWHIENGKCVPNYECRLNRQYMPKDLKETGAFVITKRDCVTANSRFGEKIAVYEVPENEAGDIDTPEDWLIAQYQLNRKNILIRLEGYPKIGLGHVYRGLLLAENFIEHNILFAISDKSQLGIQKLEQSHYRYHVITNDDDFLKLVEDYHTDIVINDILNTNVDYMNRLRQTGVRIVNFEDLGEGRYLADAVINALYEKQDDTLNSFWGDKYYLIRDEFLLEAPKDFDEEVKEILVIFGGTDPNNLTYKAVQALIQIANTQEIHCTVVLGMGYQNADVVRQSVIDMSEKFDIVQDVKLITQYMAKADLAISSQGRTMLELVAMGVPTILMAQNERETTHEFGSLRNGFLNLGLGRTVEKDTIYETVQWLIHCPQIRKSMRDEMLAKDLTHGIGRVKRIILGENEN